jgi:hypothetical protein
MSDDPFHLEFPVVGIIDREGHLIISGEDGRREPICSACGQPIPWILDMMSFEVKAGRFYAQHAACAWTPSAFLHQYKRAATISRRRLMTSDEP